MAQESLQNNKRVLLHIILIAIIGFVAYANSLNGKFIWDDYWYIKDNNYIKSWSYIGNMFTENMGAGYADIAVPSYFFRPIQGLTYMIDYSLWGLNTFGYHLMNILLHILVVLLLYRLTIKIFESPPLALLAALLYIVHPAHVEAVASIAGRADSLYAAFILTAFILYISLLDSFSRARYFFMLLCFALSLLSKEAAIVFPLILFSFHYAFKKKMNGVLLLSVFAVLILYLLARPAYLDKITGDTLSPGMVFQRVPVFFAALANYAKILFFPVGLRVHYGDSMFGFLDKQALLGMLIFIFIIFFSFGRRRKDAMPLFCAAWFFCFLLPATNIIKINDSFLKEHWLYLSSFGFFLILARGLLALKNKYRVFGSCLIAAVIAFYGFCTVKQNEYWKDPVIFLKRSLQYSPGYPVFYSELGREYENMGKFREAIEYYKQAIAINPELPGAYANLAIAFEKTGDQESAIKAYRHAQKVNIQLARRYNDFATLYIARGKFKKAAELLKKSLEIDPKSGVTHNDLAVAYYYMKKYDLAMKHCNAALELGYKVSPELFQLLAPYGKVNMRK